MSRFIRRLSNASITSITSLGTSSNGLPGVVGSAGPMDIPAGADPQACFEVFCSHWAQIKGIIVKQNAVPSGGPNTSRLSLSKATFDDVQAVANYTFQMVYLLVEETKPNDILLGSMLELTLRENVMHRLLDWTLHCSSDQREDMKREILRIYEMMLAQAKQPLLMHNALLNPLLRLLIECSERCSEKLELHLVLLLHQLCVSMTKDPMLLEYLFQASPNQGPTKFLIFSLLNPFLHQDGKVGQQARDALLLCISISTQRVNIARYITESTNLCPVLATGLGGLYSHLPRCLEISVEHWHCLTREDWSVIPELCMFLHSLEFCNSVIKVAHPMVGNQLLKFFHDGFLVPVIGPALHQFSVGDSSPGNSENPGPQDEIVAATAYVNLFLTSITSPSLMKVFLRFLCTDMYDGKLVLESLLTRIATNSRLCLVTLSLFHTLINLNCEDFMVELLFKYLVPCNHIMVSQREAIKEVDLHGKAAEKFLQLRPVCSQKQSGMESVQGNPQPTPRGDVVVASRATPAMQIGNGIDRGNQVTISLGNTEISALSTAWRREGMNNGNSPPMVLQQQQSVPAVPDRRLSAVPTGRCSLSELETSQLEYLLDAQDGIRACTAGTSSWSLPYDGVCPQPAIATPDSLSPTEDRSRAMSPPLDETRIASIPESPIRAENMTSVSDSAPGQFVLPPRPRRVDSKLMASIQEVLSLQIGAGAAGAVDTLDVLPDLFVKESCRTSSNCLHRTEALPGQDLAAADNIFLAFESEMDYLDSNDNPVEPLHSPDDSVQVVRKISTGKLRPKDLNVSTGKVIKQFQETDSAFSGSISPMVDGHYNGCSVIVAPVGGTQKGTQVENWLQALGEDTESSSYIDSLTDDNKKEIPPSLVRLGSERDCDEPCVFWEFDSNGEPSPKSSSGATAKATIVTAGIQGNEQSPTVSVLKRSWTRDRGHMSGHQPSKPDELLSSSLDENHFSMNGSLISEQNLDMSGSESNFGLPQLSTPKSAQHVMADIASKPLYGPIGRVIGTPYAGPFMEAIFSRLETMMQNSFYVNLLLTGIITRLAYYPQPLLRSYLLNTSMVFQPSVKSLFQILTSIRNKLNTFSVTIPEFEDLLVRALEYLFLREKGEPSAFGDRRSSDVMARDITRPRSGSLKSQGWKPANIFHMRSMRRNKSISAIERQKLSKINEAAMALPAASVEYNTLKTRNAVYCAAVFTEFLKELAAISQEHAVAFSERELGLRS